MSEENIEMVRRLVDAWNRRDIEALLELGGPEIAFVNSPTAVEPGTRRGTDEVVAAVRKQWEILDARSEVDEFFDRGDEIFALGRLSRGMPGSDRELEQPLLVSYTLRNQKLIQAAILGFGVTEVETALEAAGLARDR
jgi:ketosteroid isomerase-like protein